MGQPNLPRLPFLALLFATGLGGCNDNNAGPSIGRWSDGITSQLAFVPGRWTMHGSYRVYGELQSIRVAISSDLPPRAIAHVPDSLGKYVTVLVRSLAWSPRADTLAVGLWIPFATGSREWTWYIDPSGVRPPRDDLGIYSTWAPDGRLGFCSSGTIYLGGIAVFRVALIPGEDLVSCPSFDVSPDGGSLVLSRVIDRRELAYNYYAWTMGVYLVPLADTAAARLLAVDTMVAYGSRCLENCLPYPSLSVAVSPAGDQIAFVSGPSLTGEQSIWTVGVDGSAPRRLTSGPSDHGPPAWSRDGRWVMFLRGESEMVAIRADGSDSLRLLTTPDGIGVFAWSRQ